MKYTLHISPVNGGPFNCLPARSIELEDERIAATGADCSACYPGSSHNMRDSSLYVIGNEFGALGAVWATNEQDALDELVNRDLAGGILVDQPQTEEQLKECEEMEYTQLGNAGEYCDLTHAWIQKVHFDPARDIELIVALAKAEGANVTFLSEA